MWRRCAWSISLVSAGRCCTDRILRRTRQRRSGRRTATSCWTVGCGGWLRNSTPTSQSRTLTRLSPPYAGPRAGDLLAENWRVYRLLVNGVPIERRTVDGDTRHDVARLVDFDDPNRNDFAVVNQFTVEQDNRNRRPDVVAFVNGLPLGLIELKIPGQEGATLRGAWNQLRTYATQIPALLTFPAVNVISTGTQARMGALGGAFEHYAPWKTIDGRVLAPAGLPELEVLVRGVFAPATFLDLVRNFVVFTDERAGLVKRVAKYHQFHAVNKAVAETTAAVLRGDGPGRCGVAHPRVR